jgi:hypothetical protein
MKHTLTWPGSAMIRIVLTRLALIAALSMTLGCELPEPPEVITISQPPTSRPAKPSDVKTVEEAMAAIVTVCREDLHLPIVDPIQLFLYKHTATFEAYGQLQTTSSSAFARANELHINLEKTRAKRLGPPIEHLAMVELLAHEYGHVISKGLARTRLKTEYWPIWFEEGFAGWVAAKVLNSLGWQEYGLTLHRAKLELTRNRDLLTTLDGSDRLNWYTVDGQSKDHIRTYILAFVAVDRLIEMAGFSATLQYLKTADFAEVFLRSRDTFQTDFLNFLSTLDRPNNSIAMPKPKWRVGDQWVYSEKTPEARRTVVREVIREDAFQGIPSYVVKRGDEESFYTKETLGFIASMENGKLTLRRDKSAQTFSWPLSVGKEWRNAYAEENLKNKSKNTIDLSMVVSTIEEITVPAGTFQAAKIEVYDQKSGHLVFERWYSPRAKYYVKTRAYFTQEGLIEQDLVSFKVDAGK